MSALLAQQIAGLTRTQLERLIECRHRECWYAATVAFVASCSEHFLTEACEAAESLDALLRAAKQTLEN